MTTKPPSTTLLRRADQFQVDAMGGVLQANKPMVGGQSSGGMPSAGLFYWSHSHFTDDFEFGLHGHQGFEIMTFVLDGENSHFDTAGTTWVPLHRGDVQIIRAGSGISHNERVAKGTRAFQIWFDPGYAEALEPDCLLEGQLVVSEASLGSFVVDCQCRSEPARAGGAI